MAAKIMVIDDDDLVLLAIQELLTPLGFAVETHPNGPEALERLAKNHFDLIILDVIMPEMDGFEVCRRVREIPAYAETPILMLTARSSDEDRKKGMEVGANLYLPKPISPTRLIAMVKEALK
jgi:CheY-like chemotaxis protein